MENFKEKSKDELIKEIEKLKKQISNFDKEKVFQKYSEELKESEEKYRILIDNIQDGVFLIRDEKILFANKAFAAIIGYTTDEVIGEDFKKFIAPEDMEMAANNYEKRMKGEPAPNKYEFRAIHKDKLTRIFVTMTVNRINYENKPAVLGTIKDFSEYKKMQEVLANKEKHYRTLFDLSPSGIVVTDTESNILDVNESFCKSHGYTIAELQGANIRVLVPKDKQKEINMHIREMLNGKTLRGEVINICKDGSLRNIELNETKVILPDGQTGILSITNDITERKQAEEDYRTMIEQSNDMIWTLNKNGDFTFFNSQSEEITGYSLKDWKGKTFAPLIVKEDLSRVTEIFMSTVIKGQSANYEVGIIGKTGKNLILSVNTAPIIKAGKIIGTVSFGRDITEQKLTEETLKQSEKSYRDLFNSATDAIYIQDSEGRFLDVNQGAVDMYGYSKEFFIGKTPGFLSAPGKNDMKKIIGFVKDAFKGKPRQYDFWGIRKNGEVFPKIVRSQKVLFQGRDVIITFALDITEHKRAENALKESEAKYRLLAENTIDCIWKMDKDLKFTYINKSIFPMLGFTQEEWVGSTLTEHCSKKELQYFMNIVEDELQKEDTYSSIFELNLFHKDGRDIPLEVLGKILLNKNKEITGFQGNARDITERKQTEKELNKHREHLKDLVKLRTAELEEKNKDLEEFNELFIGREFRIKELKDRVKELERKL